MGNLPQICANLFREIVFLNMCPRCIEKQLLWPQNQKSRKERECIKAKKGKERTGRATMERATMEKATMEKATMEKATMEKATMEKATMEKATMEKDMEERERKVQPARDKGTVMG